MNLYHGSPVKINNDRVIACGTYFTDDIEVAKNYGNIIYSIDCDDNLLKVFKKDALNEHWINGYAIPLHMFEIIEQD